MTRWKVGDRIIVTVSKESEDGGSSYRQSARKPRRVETEERFITAIDGATLAVQAYRGKRLPKQVLPFDPNDGAGFWWANERNTFTLNVACENDEYGYHFRRAMLRRWSMS